MVKQKAKASLTNKEEVSLHLFAHLSVGPSKTQIEGTVSTNAVKIEIFGRESSAFTYITFDGTGK